MPARLSPALHEIAAFWLDTGLLAECSRTRVTGAKLSYRA